jgi:hypothetical protein
LATSRSGHRPWHGKGSRRQGEVRARHLPEKIMIAPFDRPLPPGDQDTRKGGFWPGHLGQMSRKGKSSWPVLILTKKRGPGGNFYQNRLAPAAGRRHRDHPV